MPAMRSFFFASALLLTLSFGAQANTIDFDTGSADELVDSFYSGLRFSEARFAENYGQPGSSGTLGIISSQGYQWDANNPISVYFKYGISNFSIGVLDLGVNGFTINAYDENKHLLGSETKYGTGTGEDFYDIVSVSYSDITSIEMYQVGSTFGDGIILDNMSYIPEPIPEPETYALMGLGLAALLARRHYQLKK
ncbi:hypothetical protein CSQ88_19880 [Iodobacter sp. BJB302]|nr:hypothetical protein CSQ88_19880 [Iodobacter sp. BJB302]